MGFLTKIKDNILNLTKNRNDSNTKSTKVYGNFHMATSDAMAAISEYEPNITQEFEDATKSDILNVPIIKEYMKYLTPYYKELFEIYLDNMHNIVFSNDRSRRSYKTKSCYDSVNEIFERLKIFITYSFIDFDMFEYLNGKKYIKSNDFSPHCDLILAILNSKDSERLLKIISNMIYDNEGVLNLSYELIRGMIQSDNKEAIKMVMDLLKAARVSEGLRQSVVENIDQGSHDTYIYFLKYIKEENLTRFSSVKRSFLTFTGLTYMAGDKNIDKISHYVFETLLQNKTNEYLMSKNQLKYYIGLYALACEEFNDAIKHIGKTFTDLDEYKKGVATYFMCETQLYVNADFITKALENSSFNTRMILICYMPELSFGDSDEKKIAFSKAYIKALSPIKSKDRFHLFTDGKPQDMSFYNVKYVYNLLIDFVDELNQMHEEVYALFDKYGCILHYDKKLHKKISNAFEKSPYVREMFIKGIISNQSSMRSFSFQLLEKLDISFTKDEYFVVGECMKSRRSDSRKYASDLLHKADTKTLLEVAQSLLETDDKNRKSGAISLLVDSFDRVKNLPAFFELKAKIKDMSFDESISDDVQMLLGKKSEEMVFEFDTTKGFSFKQLDFDLSKIEEFLHYDFKKVEEYIEKFHEIFMSHKDEEISITYYDGSKEVVKVGFHEESLFSLNYDNHVGKRYTNYSFYEDYIPFADELSAKDLILFLCAYDMMIKYQKCYTNSNMRDDLKVYEYFTKHKMVPDLKYLSLKYMDTKDENNHKLIHAKLNTFNSAIFLLIDYFKEEKQIDATAQTNEFFANIAAYLLEKEQERLSLSKQPVYFYDLAKCEKDFKKLAYGKYDGVNPHIRLVFSEFPFFINRVFLDSKSYFNEQYIYDLLCNLASLYKNKSYPWSYKVFFDFYEKGYLDEDILYGIVFDKTVVEQGFSKESRSEFILSGISYELNRHNDKDLLLQSEKDIYKKATDFMLNVELNRTLSDTPYSQTLRLCNLFFGANIFLKAVQKMGKMPFARGYVYGANSKKESFSHVISCVVPEEDLTQEEFNTLANTYKIDTKKLIEASMYNLRFIGFMEEYLGLEGLTKAAYYFKAHMNDSLSDKDKTIIRRYSDIDFGDFANGQMDIEWFKSSYKQLGKKNFELVYNSAKYITDGAKHKRAQYFADAVLGKLSIEEVENRINDKRNQDMLLAYSLLPLRGDKNGAALKRYKRLQLFLKESKKVGAQRRASEAIKVSISINNLARNYGVDEGRFPFIMESKLIEKLDGYFSPHKIDVDKDTFSLYLDLSEPNKPEIAVYKNEKRLKSVPTKIAKNNYVKELKSIKKELKEQYMRAKDSFEQSMIHEELFSLDELNDINQHPIISSITKGLLFVCENDIGLVKKDLLVTLDKEIKLTSQSKLKIAHPFDMFEQNWTLWQEFILKNRLKQPFKQVFRELYVMTEDELKNDGYTNRFSGFQVEFKRTLGIMKSRGWMPNEYEGFEKINHKSNLRINLYSYAHWFTANDVEPPSIEKIEFNDNKTGKTFDMKKLNPILFSETMRDVDLVVSVAYVGGVDPMYSHTTMQMRERIIKYNLELFKITNCNFDKNHIIVNGKFGNYSIHKGSGIVHKEGKGMLPIFPVHSHQRGHIFLPFVDEDLKTSEIISKILMLAKDDKIKDPSVLIHLR